jgi:archaellum component FlaG (FlaF/FlaG flagellin family)
MDVSGNATSIADGDVTPTTADDTDYGDVNITNGSVEHTFTITNTGSATLSLTDASPYVTITGHTSDFTLTQTPSNSIAASAGTTTFRVTFDPTRL